MPSHNFQDLTGRVFGRLTVLARDEEKSTRVYWRCECKCGTLTSVAAHMLKSGRTTSCGCLARQLTATRNIRHGHAVRSAHSRTYDIWADMRKRCSMPTHRFFHRYGGRGITVCSRWSDFRLFLADMGEAPAGFSIDRIDNNKGYEPQNCRWATKTEQARNKSSSRLLTVAGETLPLAVWAEKTGLSYYTIYLRLRRGATAEEAVSAAPPKRNRAIGAAWAVPASHRLGG